MCAIFKRVKQPTSPRLEVLIYFVRLGIAGFGGPLALVADMQRDLIEARRWMEPEPFARAFALIKAMPGPVAFQTAVFLGHHRAGFWGGVAAALGLIFPPFVMMVLFGVFYGSWRHLSGSASFLTGMQATAIGVIIASLKNLSGPQRKKLIFWLLGAFAIAVTWRSPAAEPILIVGCGILTAVLFQLRSRGVRLPVIDRLKLSLAFGIRDFSWFMWGDSLAAAGSAAPPALHDLFWSCFKSGALVFGSGLAIVPLMEHDFVQRLGWLTHQEFMDSLAFGQITPGPVVITATFIGFKSLGLMGAVVGTGAIFLAPFFHMMTWFPRFNDRLSRVAWIPAFLTGAISAVVGSILATAFRLSSTLEMKWLTIPLIAISLYASLRTRIPVWLLIPLGGVVSGAVSVALAALTNHPG